MVMQLVKNYFVTPVQKLVVSMFLKKLTLLNLNKLNVKLIKSDSKD